MKSYSLTLLLVIGLPAASALAQSQSVQLPSVSNFSAGTTISVPDRGGALIGGVSRSARGTKSYGWGPVGSSSGYDISRSSVSSHVWIHDLRAMDEAILNSTPDASPTRYRFHSPGAESAWRELQQRPTNAPHRYSDGIDRSTNSSLQRTHSASGNAKQDRAEMYLQLGAKAEKRGDLAIARLHYRVGAKYGSLEAKSRLQALQSRNDGQTASVAAPSAAR